MKELLVRAASGAVFVTVVLGAALLGPYASAALFAGVCVIGATELHGLLRPRMPSVALATAIGLAYIVLAAVPLARPALAAPALALALSALLLAALPLLRRPVLSPLALAFLGAAYLAAPFAFATWLCAIDPWLFIGFMCLLWANDTGAYLVGKAIGRHKLMPKVSPGKTWEGFIGGVGMAILLAWPISGWSAELPLQGWILAAAAVAIAGTVGDLYESALKRRAGVKDSGRVMPGHGGVLDRFDGYLLAAPAMLLIVLLLR